MATFECPVCGKKYEVDDFCCAEHMIRTNNHLRCRVCETEKEIPSCCGGEMKQVTPD